MDLPLEGSGADGLVLSTLRLIVDQPLLFHAHMRALIFLVFALVFGFYALFLCFLTDVDSFLCER